jgi:GntR family transcriptional repressor for pyruvate dehydrogenase complex
MYFYNERVVLGPVVPAQIPFHRLPYCCVEQALQISYGDTILIQRQTITAQVIEYLLGLIKSGQVKPGERMPTEKQLTEELSVSRTCVREAIKSLESLQLIKVRPRVGAIVLEPSPAALLNANHLSASAYVQRVDLLIEFRKILEVGLVMLAAEKSTEEDWAEMRAVLADHERAVKIDRTTPEGDALFYKEVGEINVRFHKAIAEATRNPIAILVLQAISEPLAMRSRRTNEKPGVAENGLREHWAIYRAIREQNPEKSRNAMRAHIQSAERNARAMQPDESEIEMSLVHLP